MKTPHLLFCLLLLGALPGGARASLDDGLVASLPLRSDLRDHAAGNLPVKMTGNVVLKNGSAFFAGDGNYLELPYIPLNQRDFSVSMWVSPTGNFPTYGLLQQIDRDAPDHLLHFLIREGLHPWMGFYVNDTVSPIGLTNDGAWKQLVFQYTDGAQEIWIDGRLICRRQTVAYQGVAGATYIGRAPKWNNVPTRDFEGYLSDVRIYSRALKAAEIDQLARLRPPDIGGTIIGGGASTASANPVPTPAAGAPLLNIRGGTMQVSGAPGQMYTVEASSDLQRWGVLGTVTVGSEGTVDIVDTEAGNFPQRFYRLRSKTP